MRKKFASVVLLSLSILSLTLSFYGQTVPKPSKKETPRSPEIVAILNESRLAAPELGADTFLRVAGSGKVTDAAWRREILDEALRLADDAKNPVRRVVIPLNGGSVDTNAGYLSYAFDLKLDRSSLKSRVIRAVLAHDKERARQIVFEMGGDLGLKPLSCEDALAYDVSEIYSTVGAVAKAAFTPKEIEEGIRGLFVAPWLENISSPAQVGPALSLLSAMNGSAQEKQLLFAALSKSINRNFEDDRSFTHAFDRNRLGYYFGHLTSGDKDAHLKADIIASVRGMLIKNIGSARCKENQLKKDAPVPRFISEVNSFLGDKPISAGDIETSEVKEQADIRPYWQSQTAIQLMKDYREIASTKGKDAFTPEELAKVSQFADKLAAWTPKDKETEIEVFNQKSVMYRSLIGIVNGSLKSQFLRTYLRYLSSSPIQKENFIQWFYYLQDISGREAAMFKQVSNEVPNQHFSLIVQLKELKLR